MQALDASIWPMRAAGPTADRYYNRSNNKRGMTQANIEYAGSLRPYHSLWSTALVERLTDFERTIARLRVGVADRRHSF
jgi:hypothetical protein